MMWGKSTPRKDGWYLCTVMKSTELNVSKMSQICYNAVCNRDQRTDGCPAAEWCPYYIGDYRATTTSSSTEIDPDRRAIVSNTTEVR